MIEKTLQFGLFLIPNRWSEHELQSDLCMLSLCHSVFVSHFADCAITNLISSFHDYLWTSTALDVKKGVPLPEHAQIPDEYVFGVHRLLILHSVREKLEKAPYFPENQLRLSTMLSYISNLEILLELLAIMNSRKDSTWSSLRNLRWTVVFIIEAIK